MARDAELQVDRAGAVAFASDFAVNQLDILQHRSSVLYQSLALRVGENAVPAVVVWPPDGPYRDHFIIARTSLDPDDTGINVTINSDNRHITAPRPRRVGISAGRLATLWGRGDAATFDVDGLRPLMIDEVVDLTNKIINGRIVQPNEVAEHNRVYTRGSFRYRAHRIALTLFGANF